MKLKFNVTGMTCAACSARVEKVTRAVAGVEKAEVNLLGGTMQVEAAEDVSAAIIAAVASGKISKFQLRCCCSNVIKATLESNVQKRFMK